MYPDLFEKIGTTYGAGDGSTTFNLPNLSDNRFVEGSTVAGTVKQAGLPNIEGTIESIAGGHPTGAFSTTSRTINDFAGGNYHGNYRTFDASQSNPIYGASDTVQPKSLTLRYFIQAFDGQTPDSALIDITQYAQELATKANRQLSNLDTANLACHVVVDSYYDSTTGDWWREYDDGWLEQGGFSVQTSAPQHHINFLKPFKNTDCTCVATPCRPTTVANGTDFDATIGSVMAVTTTYAVCGITVNHAYGTINILGWRWVAYGQGASV
jgi:hypothetical protein